MVGSAAKKPQQWALTSRTVPSARANTRSSCASFSAMQADERIAFASDAAFQKLAARLDAAPARSHCIVFRVPEDAVAVQMIAWLVSDPLRSRSHAVHCMTSTGGCRSECTEDRSPHEKSALYEQEQAQRAPQGASVSWRSAVQVIATETPRAGRQSLRLCERSA
jgi:hypothetical protein